MFVFEAADLVGHLRAANFGVIAGGQRVDRRLLDLADARVARLLLGDRDRPCPVRPPTCAATASTSSASTAGALQSQAGLARLGGEFLDRR